MNLPERAYTAKDVDRARNRAQLVGRLQGGAAVIVGAIVLNLLGWVPAVLAVGAVGYGAFKVYKWLSRSSGGDGGGSGGEPS